MMAISPAGMRRRARSTLHRAWLTLLWPGLRMMLKTIAFPLALFVGLPASLRTLASIEHAARLTSFGELIQAGTMFVVAWICGSMAALAFWPRKL